MILTNCAACAAPLAHDAPRCVRCHTRYCDATSRLFQRCPTLRTFQEGDVSNLAADAGPINGTYCRRYRDAAVATRASFNENPWELMRNNNM